MSLRRRLMWGTILGLLVMFAAYHLFIYFFFMKITTDGELKLLWNRAQIALRNPSIRLPAEWGEEGLLTELLSEHAMARIIDPSGTVRGEAANDPDLLQLQPVYRRNYHTMVVRSGEERRLYIQVPILQNKKQIAVLELGKSLSVLREYAGVLLTILSAAAAMSVIFSIAAGIGYTRFVLRPIARLATTMERSEQSGSFRRLEETFVSGKDEFARLGLTFNRMMETLQENYDQQQRFVEDASHELRTPLTVIESYASMLQRWGGKDPELRAEALEAIQQESARLRGLTEHLLRLARREEAFRKVEQVNLLKLLQETAAALALSFAREIRVMAEDGESSSGSADSRDWPVDSWVVEGVMEELKQLFIILLDNALKYSEKQVEIHLAKPLNESAIIIRVRDYGIGVAVEHRKRLFDRFYRVDQARSRHSGGTGLGLSIAKRIVDQHQGTIELSSTLGHGTEVAVTLPVLQQPSPVEEPL